MAEDDLPPFANPDIASTAPSPETPAGDAPPAPAEAPVPDAEAAGAPAPGPGPSAGAKINPGSESVVAMQCMETFFDILVQCWNEFDKAKFEHKDTKKLLHELSEILMKGDYGSTVAMAATLIQRQGRELPASYHEAARLAKKYHG